MRFLVPLCVFLLAGCASAPRPAPPVTPPARPPAHALIPIPAQVRLAPTDTFRLTPTTPVRADDDAASAIGAMVLGWIGPPVDGAPEVPAHSGTLRVLRQPGLGDEGYRLAVTSREIRLEATTDAGLFYAAQTLRQLLAPEIEFEAAFPRAYAVPGVRIEDRPRFAWRGAMLDVARHFLPPEDVKRFIDVMVLYKLNRLHLHLADDQGWRIEIPGWPRLTEVGGRSEVGGGAGGFYTLAEYAEIVRYAAERHVMVVPEIDVPGHTNAALVSYPELTCSGEAPPPYTGIRVGFSFLCVEKEETYAFLDAVMGTLAEVTPGPFLHIGGDEVKQLSAEQYARFVARAQAIVHAHGKRVIGWDEIAEVDLVPGSVVQVWRPLDPSASPVPHAVAAGAELVLSPADRIYLDMKRDSTTTLGLNWAGYNGIRDAYDWDPAHLLPGVPETSILGVEAPLWSETLATFSDVTLMALPRLVGVAEIGWSPQASRQWDAYRHRLAHHAARWTALGLTYDRAPEVPWPNAP